MKLYGLMLSPFVARVRLAMRVKNIDCALEPPPGGAPRSSEFLAINPIGRVPVLLTDDGLSIAESETIIDHLDEAFPSPPLIPVDQAVRARMRNAIRVFELYVTPAMSRLFGQLGPASRNQMIVEAEIERWRDGLALTSNFIDDGDFAVGGGISKADCMLLPSLLLCRVAGTFFGIDDIVDNYPILAGYRDKARRHPDMGPIWEETETALAASTSG